MLCAAFGANQIRWQWQGQCVYAVAKDGSRFELGLRDDGVVVWREITNTTNSPAEQSPLVITNWSGSTNIWLYGAPQSLPKEWFNDDLIPRFVPN